MDILGLFAYILQTIPSICVQRIEPSRKSVAYYTFIFAHDLRTLVFYPEPPSVMKAEL
jgi:hypothetical protein